MSGKEKNISEKQLTEQEMQFCELYVNGGLEFAGRAVSINAAKAFMEIFPIRHKEENRLRIEGSDGNVIFNVIVLQTRERNEGEKEI